MKLLDTTVAIIDAITYDNERDCYVASINKSILNPIWYGPTVGIIYSKTPSIYIEFGTISLLDLRVGETITIQTYKHESGDSIKLYNGELIFSYKGITNIITERN